MPAVGPLLFRVFAVFLLCMAALLVVVAGWSRSTARHEARQNAAELTRLVESQVARMFEAADILLIHMTDLAAATDWSDDLDRRPFPEGAVRSAPTDHHARPYDPRPPPVWSLESNFIGFGNPLSTLNVNRH
jgi:hypothetical protein